TPVYCISLAGLVQRTLVDPASPLSKIDWSRANTQLKTLARVSNGRTYLRDAVLDIPAIYDDLMEHLRVRYVITYTSSGGHSGGSMRRVRVALVDPRTGGPLRVTDAAGKAITARGRAIRNFLHRGDVPLEWAELRERYRDSLRSEYNLAIYRAGLPG